jgi:transcriptional regulator
MFRKDLIALLLENPMSLTQIARGVQQSPKDVADDVNHLLRSLKHSPYQALVEPGQCRACGFKFSEGKLNKPSKCPECHSTWVLEPKISLARKGS